MTTEHSHATAPASRRRVRASQLRGRGWLNTGGRPLELADLSGKIVLLDFWTFCCVNCLHVLDELRPLEERFADVLVTIGVHSPKFVHEADADALAAAVERYAVHHPVLDDPTLQTWDAYTAKAWPTLVVVDPQGYVVAQLSGEGHAHGLAVLIEELVVEHEAKGTLRRGEGPYIPPPAPTSRLRFPGKVAVLPDGSLLVSDTAHHQLVVLDGDLETERLRIGDGTRGLVDGDAAAARFSEPQGVAVLPPAVAERLGYDVVVADSVNHALRGLRLSDGTVTTVAGTGSQLRQRVTVADGPRPALDQPLSTPWDVAWWHGRVAVAMAGSHQLWSFDPDPDSDPDPAPAAGRVSAPEAATVAVLAGTTNEGLVDGDGPGSWFAQPSGLAVGPDGTLWVADSETSAVRAVRLATTGSPGSVGDVADIVVETAVGQGLFDFGFRDGPVDQAMLQHPLGVAVLPDGSVAVADTYNGAVRRIADGQVTTLAVDLAEPSALIVEQDGDTPVLLVVESAAHRLTRIAIPVAAQRVDGQAHRVRRSPTDVTAGPLRLVVRFTPPTGQKLDDRFGDPSRLAVSSSPPELLVSGSGSAQGLSRDLVLSSAVPTGVLHVSVQAAACDEDGTESAACHLYQQDWGLPVVVGPAVAASGAASPSDPSVAELELHLRGV